MKKGHVAIIVLASFFVVSSLAVIYTELQGVMGGPFIHGVPGSFAMIQKVSWSNSTGQIMVTVQHAGDAPITLSEVYVNGTLDSSAEFNSTELSAGAFSEITLSETYQNKPTETTIRVVCVEGSFTDMIFNPEPWYLKSK